MKNEDKKSPNFYIGSCKNCANEPVCTRGDGCHKLCGDFVQACEGVKYDDGKLAYNLLPMDALDEVVKRFTYGAEKYPVPDNWKKTGDAVERYSAALMRHYSAYRQGEQADPDAPGLSHIGAVAWNALALVWFELRGYKPEKDGNAE
ncbi:MAG: DUF5664 domain-containing protein [Spirochaetaceae bacterium]|jgi:hypothetical protein|nr:DUF5664 domain-containing protein [Spirochaetaceae bacterium]